MEKFEVIAREIGELVTKKNEAYGNSIHRSAAIMGILYPDGIPTYQYIDTLLVVRVLDKLSRIATNNDPSGESPWRDIAGYGILGAAKE